MRIEKTLLGLAHKLAEGTGQRITDVLERGVLLAVEEGLGESVVTQSARFAIAKATPEEQHLVVLALAFWRSNRLDPVDRAYLKKRLQMPTEPPPTD